MGGRFSEDRVQNPSVFRAEWSSKLNNFYYYDKELVVEGSTETGGNVIIPMPVRFVVLDKMVSVRGYNEEQKGSFYSNMIGPFDTKKKNLIVKCKGKTVIEGLYADIKETKALKGAKFCTEIFVMFYNEKKEPIIVTFSLYGTAQSSFRDFEQGCKEEKNKSGLLIKIAQSKHDIYKCAIEVKKSVVLVKGNKDYNSPVFTAIATSTASEESAKQLYVELQDYFVALLKRGSNKPDEEQEHNNNIPTTTSQGSMHHPNNEGEDDDLPF